MGYEGESHGWNISLYVKGATVAANFPNFANKLPETKIPQRIVKVLTSSPILAVFLCLPFCLWYSLYHSVISRERNISRWTLGRNKWTKIKLQNENHLIYETAVLLFCMQTNKFHYTTWLHLSGCWPFIRTSQCSRIFSRHGKETRRSIFACREQSSDLFSYNESRDLD